MSHATACPHCGAHMSPIRTPDESSWGGEIHEVCFNDDCCYFVESWNSLGSQGICSTGYRCRVDPRGCFGPAPVWSESALKDMVLSEELDPAKSLHHFSARDLARDDESSDTEFYAKPRFVNHLDTVALDAVESLYGRLIPAGARVLDLMTGPDSHLSRVGKPASVVGLGLNKEELDSNRALHRYVIRDINSDPRLPFGDTEFDAVINTVSVDYMTRPIEVFREVARVLRPRGLFIVVFSNRMFPPKAINIWKALSEARRLELVRRFFTLSDSFMIEGYLESTGRPRPKDDKYYELGIPSDPIYAVWGTTRRLH
ncbi:MAG: methyltransferase domain-containing protein [Pseudomonadota bacterium]